MSWRELLPLWGGAAKGEVNLVPGTCGRCRFFENGSRALEREIAGLTSFSSADADVRDRDGLCGRHERLSTERASCCGFEPRGS
jgi:hypothetical protein